MSQSSDDQLGTEELLAEFTKIVGQSGVLTGAAADALATDVYHKLYSPVCAVSPRTIDQLVGTVKLCKRYGLKVSIRGGGASYTDGYTIRLENVALLDLSKLDSICEINETDLYVTVEAGVTWMALKERLDSLGLRTPFWGPFSGLRATIGGSVSQNTISHGSGMYGISAQNVLSMDIVTADGEILRTGAQMAGGSAGLRYFGPDFTGLFTGDCGTLGVKARITLPLIRKKAAHRVASFAFEDFGSMHESMRLIGAERLEDTHFALDAALSQGQIARQERAGDIMKIAWAIFTSSPSLLEGAKQLLKAALSGKRAINNSAYMTHYIIEGFSDAEVRARLHRLRQIIEPLGIEIPASAPAVVRGMPFAPFYNTLGPQGERWVPLHGILPHSKVAEFHQALTDFYAQREVDMKAHGVWTGGMFASVGSSGFLYEIAIYWPDEITDYHRREVPADYLATLPVYPQNEPARAYVEQLKSDLVDLFCQYQAVNFQLGKMYPFRSRLQPEAQRLLDNIKGALDPSRRISTDSLGL